MPARLDDLALLEAIYDASEPQTDWRGVMAHVGRALGAERGHAFLIEGMGTIAESHVLGYTEAEGRWYHDNFQAVDPRLAIAGANAGRAISDVDVLDSKSFE